MKYDVVILGSSINGMTSAAYIAKQGLKVAVIDKNNFTGGIAGSREINTTNGSRKTRGILQDTSTYSKKVFQDLNLSEFGLKKQKKRTAIPSKGKPFVLSDMQSSAENLENSSDVDSYKKFCDFMKLYTPMVQKTMTHELPNISNLNISTAWEVGGLGLSLRTKGKRAMNELLRAVPMCSADFLNEYFENDALKAGLAVPSVTGNLLGPWSPASNAMLICYYALSGEEVVGGPSELVDGLEKKCKKLGVDFLMGETVQKIQTKEDKVVGLEMQDGNVMPVRALMSALDVKTTFLKKLDRCPFKVRKRIENFRMRGTTAHIDFFLNDIDLNYFEEHGVNRLHICESLDGIEQSFDPIKYKALPERPLIELVYSKEYKHVSALVHFVPYELEGGWNESSKSALTKTVVHTIGEHVQGFSDSIQDSHVYSPIDIESDHELWGGQIQYGEFGLDQAIMRPIPELTDNTTHLDNLFLCSESQHPGGLLTGIAAKLASQKLLKKIKSL